MKRDTVGRASRPSEGADRRLVQPQRHGNRRDAGPTESRLPNRRVGQANRDSGGTSVADRRGLRSPTNSPRPCPTLHRWEAAPQPTANRRDAGPTESRLPNRRVGQANRDSGGTSVADRRGLRSPTNSPRPCPTLHRWEAASQPTANRQDAGRTEPNRRDAGPTG